MAKASPSQRTLHLCKQFGWTVQIVERWNAFARVRQDLFGVIDLVAVTNHPDKPNSIIGIQTTSGSNHSARIEKSLAEPRLNSWMKAGGRFHVWSWAKKGDRGARKLWTVRIDEIKLVDGKPVIIDVTGKFVLDHKISYSYE